MLEDVAGKKNERKKKKGRMKERTLMPEVMLESKQAKIK